MRLSHKLFRPVKGIHHGLRLREGFRVGGTDFIGECPVRLFIPPLDEVFNITV
jgi:hypothetical protein